MQKSKVKKLAAKILILIMFLNTLAFLGNISPGLAMGGEINVVASPCSISDGESVMISWKTISKPNHYGIYSKIYQRKNNGNWQLIATINGAGSKSYNTAPLTTGSYKFRVDVYAEFVYNYGIIYGPFYLGSEESNYVIVNPLGLLNLIINPNEILVNSDDIPIEEEITLSWHVTQYQYYYTFYSLIYKNRNGQGWQFLERINGYGDKSFTYTLTEIGNYEFKVIAYADIVYNYGIFYGPFYLGSDRYNVVCAVNSRNLIGSIERHFPNDPQACLGFSILSAYAFGQDPILHFKLNDTTLPYQNVVARVKIDGVIVYEGTTELNKDIMVLNSENLNILRELRSHQIVIEIDGGSTSIDYVLKYLKIERLNFIEYELRNDDTYGPTQLFGFGPYYYQEDHPNDYDIGFIGVNSILPFAAALNGEINTPYPSFFSSIETEFDRVPIVGECMWIESIEVQYRIISPNGTLIIESRMQESGSICTSHSTDEILSPEVEAILEAIDLAISIGSLATSYIDLLLPISWIAKFLGFMEDSLDTEDYYYIEDGWYGAKWVNGDNIYSTPTGELAREVGMRFYWSTKLPQTGPDIYGPYQVQEIWKVNIYGGNGYEYTFECDNYMNFIYSPPD